MSALVISAGFFMISGCTKIPGNDSQAEISQQELINRLESRIRELEQKISEKGNSSPEVDRNTPEGPIKSITFRMGSKDDRLRIYWADGSSSDLPCTQEQSTLACG